MVDTARHFLSIPVLRRVVDSMITTKLNTLHVHLVDTQAFPLVLPSAPALSRGAYSNDEKYSLLDLGGLRQYCTARGVRLVAEIDTPGHGASWCVGMPHICPSPSCLQPLRPDKNATFDAIRCAA
jgi:hexosaminidase